ncbi:MAG TPA: hypothetical protein VMV18_14860 [bacterium]|nr:hypothetical protein [bacterium]
MPAVVIACCSCTTTAIALPEDLATSRDQVSAAARSARRTQARMEEDHRAWAAACGAAEACAPDVAQDLGIVRLHEILVKEMENASAEADENCEQVTHQRLDLATGRGRLADAERKRIRISADLDRAEEDHDRLGAHLHPSK